MPQLAEIVPPCMKSDAALAALVSVISMMPHCMGRRTLVIHLCDEQERAVFTRPVKYAWITEDAESAVEAVDSRTSRIEVTRCMKFEH